ncbi:hypothetical protein EW146_g10322, partial [Bondarzewia mesenterica]
MVAAGTETPLASNSAVYKEWNRIKDDPSLRCSIFPKPSLCFACYQICKNPQVCSGCKAIVYCSVRCQRKDWKNENVPGGYMEGHKYQCANHREHMKRNPEFKAILDQFPWVQYDVHNIFHIEMVLASRGLLGEGRRGFGYWAEHGGKRDCASACAVCEEAPWAPLSEKDGWKLPDDEIPWLNFEGRPELKPAFPPNFEENWTSYYAWRGIPLKSPAALLLHWPLAVYRCLEELGFAERDRSNEKLRRKLKIYYIGVEFLANASIFSFTIYDLYSLSHHLPPPLRLAYGELALLFPNTDLDLVMFGQRAYDSVRRAKRARHLLSSPEEPCVFQYTAPASCGSGTLRIGLHGSSANYDPSSYSTIPRPDAIIGLNAGMSSYPAWLPVFLFSCEHAIPLVTTDYSEQSMVDDHIFIRQR